MLSLSTRGSLIKPFLNDTYVKCKQATYLDTVVSKCDSQREIQSAHRSHAQATIFIAHAWVDSNSNESMVLVSDDLNYSKQSVYVFMQYIFNHFKTVS